MSSPLNGDLKKKHGVRRTALTAAVFGRRETADGGLRAAAAARRRSDQRSRLWLLAAVAGGCARAAAPELALAC